MFEFEFFVKNFAKNCIVKYIHLKKSSLSISHVGKFNLKFALLIKHQNLSSLVSSILSAPAWSTGFDSSQCCIFSWNSFTDAGCWYTNGPAHYDSVHPLIFVRQKGIRRTIKHSDEKTSGTYENYLGSTII